MERGRCSEGLALLPLHQARLTEVIELRSDVVG